MLKNPEKEDLQDKLFPIPYDWEEEWKDMPEYHNWQEADPQITATFKFRNEEDFQRFKKIISEHGYDGAKVFDGEQKKDKKQAWFPLREKDRKYYYLSNNMIIELNDLTKSIEFTTIFKHLYKFATFILLDFDNNGLKVQGIDPSKSCVFELNY